MRSSSETEDIWGAEEDDMMEGDLGYGLGRRPGGLYEVSCLTTSKKRSEGKNLSPPPLPKNGEERGETGFQDSRNKGLRGACAHGCPASGYRRQSSSGENSGGSLSFLPLWVLSVLLFGETRQLP